MSDSFPAMVNSSSTKNRNRNRSLEEAIRWAGGRKALARECRMTPNAIKVWEKAGGCSLVGARLISLLMRAKYPSLDERARLERRLRGRR